MEATIVRGTVSPLASSYIRRPFRGCKLNPEHIMRMIGDCESASTSFLSGYFSPLDRSLPEIKLSYITSRETDTHTRNSFGYVLGTDTYLILDNIFKSIAHYDYPPEILLANHHVHEFAHVYDAAHTGLMRMWDDTCRSYMKRRRELGGLPLLSAIMRRRDDVLASIGERIIWMDRIIEGRAARATVAFMKHSLGRGQYSEVDAMFYLRLRSEWHLECMFFMRELEAAFGFANAWKISESIMPISSAEIVNPKLYISRVRELGKIIRNSD